MLWQISRCLNVPFGKIEWHGKGRRLAQKMPGCVAISTKRRSHSLDQLSEDFSGREGLACCLYDAGDPRS
jgi:hypothetical protein